MVKKKKTSIHSEKLRKIKRRPSWDEYFMELAKLVATRSTCRRHAVGAVLVSDKRILATGYNGSPYTTHEPCSVCCKLLISAGVKRIVFEVPYPDDFAHSLLKEAKIKVEKWKKTKKIDYWFDRTNGRWPRGCGGIFEEKGILLFFDL
jgi:dCMP deaminase